MSLQDAVVAAKAAKLKSKPKVKRKKTPAAKRAAMRAADRAVVAKVENPNQILTFRQWTVLAGVSVDTARRLIKAGAGPILTQMSQRRIGVRLADHIRWQASRARGAV
jgi:hypothetical protein